MINITSEDRKALDQAAALPEALYGSRVYSMTALLALAVQRENYERELMKLRAGPPKIARWILMAVLVSLSTAGLVMILKSPQSPEQELARPTTLKRSADPAASVAASDLESRPDRASRPIPVTIAQPLARSAVEPDRVATDRPVPSSPSTLSRRMPDNALAGTLDRRPPIVAERSLPSRTPPPVASVMVQLTTSPQEEITTTNIEVRSPDREAQIRERNRLAAIDALRALRSR